LPAHEEFPPHAALDKQDEELIKTAAALYLYDWQSPLFLNFRSSTKRQVDFARRYSAYAWFEAKLAAVTLINASQQLFGLAHKPVPGGRGANVASFAMVQFPFTVFASTAEIRPIPNLVPDVAE